MKKTVWSSVYNELYNCTLTYRMLLTVGLLYLLEGVGVDSTLEAVGFSDTFVVVKLENEQLIGSCN